MYQFQNSKPRNFGLSVSVALNLLFVVVIAFLLTRSPSADPPGPGPISQDVTAMMADAEITRLNMEAEASEEIGRKIKAGEIKNSNQLYQWAKTYEEKIRETAYAKMNEANNKVLAEPEGGWTAEHIAAIEKFQQQKAAGKRKVAQ